MYSLFEHVLRIGMTYIIIMTRVIIKVTTYKFNVVSISYVIQHNYCGNMTSSKSTGWIIYVVELQNFDEELWGNIEDTII